MPTWGIVLTVIGGVILLIAISIAGWVISVYNALIRLRNNADEGYSTMDVYMKKRYDLIPNLVETVKGYAKHEKETLTGVIQARSAAMNSKTPEEKLANETALTRSLGKLMRLHEAYPELKADKGFMSLQSSLSSLEVEIANSRKYYNGTVKMLNNKIEIFPSNIIARRFKFEKKFLFEIVNQEERVSPKVQF